MYGAGGSAGQGSQSVEGLGEGLGNCREQVVERHPAE
jgi:hypothetical protein